ncbi:hypothetical protein C8Q80DRAFT_1157353 [Daedaleopsis nitida]|nr:hypothetical protein C8Q80DRAFT_1157353 [Daedaleopsis nitida]
MHHHSKSSSHLFTARHGCRRVAPRLNRLPQRLDYTLIPAPLDLTLPLVDEKADLPAIIVTPSSPVFESEFFIAFIAPPPSPTFAQRVSALVPSFRSYLPSQIQLPATPFKTSFDDRSTFSLRSRLRTIFLLFVLFFIMASHVVLHRVATLHPHLEFGIVPDDVDFSSLSHAVDRDIIGARVDVHETETPSVADRTWYHRGIPHRAAMDLVVEEPTLAKGNDNDSPEVHPQTAA